MSSTQELNIDTSKPVLVTGATGYVAGVLVKQLLEKGVTVHATVRDPTKTDRIQYLKDEADKTTGTLKFFRGDLLTEGSFDEAMKGCHIVFHTASPFTGTVKDPVKELLEPAVKGTENVLAAVNRTETVTRVVVTSSITAVFTNASETSEERPATEEDWNRTASTTHKPYYLSKTQAEQRAWVIAGSQARWKLVTINPTLVVGPGLKYHASSESYKYVRSLGCGYPAMKSGAVDIPLGLVDVREVGAAHIVAAFSNTASGRNILCAQTTTFPEMGQAIGKKYSETFDIVTSTLPSFWTPIMWLLAPWANNGRDRDYISKNFGRKMYIDNSKSKKELGITYRSIEESLQEMYQQLVDNGAVEKARKQKSV